MKQVLELHSSVPQYLNCTANNRVYAYEYIWNLVWLIKLLAIKYI
jgi:hypothetical protein